MNLSHNVIANIDMSAFKGWSKRITGDLIHFLIMNLFSFSRFIPASAIGFELQQNISSFRTIISRSANRIITYNDTKPFDN